MTSSIPALPEHLEITNGPSKFDLSVALFDRKRPLRTVEFALQGYERGMFKVGIESVKAEDGSGESWFITGIIWENPTKYYRFKGYFRTDNRRGWLNLQKK
jgi:hypothetical protein